MEEFYSYKEVSKSSKIENEQIDNSKILIEKAFQYHSKGDLKNAEKYYQRFIKKGYIDSRVLSNYGVICNTLGRKDEAKKLYLKSIDLYPENADAYSNLAVLLEKERKLDEAVIYAEKAVRLKPNMSISHFVHASILKSMNKLIEARNETLKAIKLNPQFAEAYLHLGAINTEMGRLEEAEENTRKAIDLNYKSQRAYTNLGAILTKQNRLSEAELYTRKALELNPNDVNANINLGGILIDQQNSSEGEEYTRKALAIESENPQAIVNLGVIMVNKGNFNEAEKLLFKSIKYEHHKYKSLFYLSKLRDLKEKEKIEKILFQDIDVRKIETNNLIYLYFAKSEILHRKKDFKQSGKYLEKANDLRLNVIKSNKNDIIENSKKLNSYTKSIKVEQYIGASIAECIFIVGMPRSGSTLVETILDMNPKVVDLGECDYLKKAYLEWTSANTKTYTLYEYYLKKRKSKATTQKITTDKNLYNYMYSGLIAKSFPKAKIIHCSRNPMDNVLSLYKANFWRGNYFSSSITDSAELLIHQKELMEEYKLNYKNVIYSINYDNLVSNPKKELKSLISWLGWEWSDDYLNPHKNKRTITTASNIQIRSPINTKSVGGWKNYKDILEPALQIFIEDEKFKSILK
tara:strand:- start:16928 stop:18826 length:1899 start_codon:yes stop_codon:yes gene_type:complete